MKQPLLSICIPTYNRHHKLDDLISKIRKDKRIEICISDNASTDGTADFLKHLSNSSPFKIFISKKNEGADRNVLQVCSLATGRYIWLMGDDDSILKTGAERVLSYLEKTENEIIYVQTKEAPAIHSENPVIYPMGFLSSIIFRRDKFLEIPKEDLEQGIGTLYEHSWTLALIGIKNPRVKAITIPEPVISVNPENYGRIKLKYVLGTFGGKLRLYKLTMKKAGFQDKIKLRYLWIRDIFLLCFNILSERKFRSEENLMQGDFPRKFFYVYYVLVKHTPKVLVDFKFNAIVFIMTTLKLTKHGSDRWEKLWTKTDHYTG